MKHKYLHGLLGVGVLCVSAAASAVTMFGTLANFDVVNDTGEPAYGFEIELDGVSSAGYSFSANRYGAPTVIPFNGGVYVRWQAPWDAATQQFRQGNQSVPQLVGAGAATAVNTVVTPTAGHQCVYWLPNYANSGCDHFGQGLPYYVAPTRVVYRWLVADPATPGGLLYAGTNVAPAAPTPAAPVPAAPPAQVPVLPLPPVVAQVPVAQPNVVEAVVQAPPPPRPDLQFGEAQWVKVFKRELPREVGLDELQGDNVAVVPEDAAEVETTWKLLQHNPHNPDSGSSQLRSGGQVSNGSRSVVRRYEYYKFTGQYDPVDHGAICADGLCNAPAADEIGGLVAANMVAHNIGNPSITVTRSGNGTVSGAVTGSKKSTISCGNVCSASYSLNDTVVLQASPSAGAIFDGWSGDCSGMLPTCTVNVTDQMNVGAKFAQVFTLSIGGTGGNGSVTGTPDGVQGTAINCGPGGCKSAKFIAGTAVTLNATPTAGHQFLGWMGGCSGVAPTCVVTVNANVSVTANFK